MADASAGAGAIADAYSEEMRAELQRSFSAITMTTKQQSARVPIPAAMRDEAMRFFSSFVGVQLNKVLRSFLMTVGHLFYQAFIFDKDNDPTHAPVSPGFFTAKDDGDHAGVGHMHCIADAGLLQSGPDTILALFFRAEALANPEATPGPMGLPGSEAILKFFSLMYIADPQPYNTVKKPVLDIVKAWVKQSSLFSGYTSDRHLDQVCMVGAATSASTPEIPAAILAYLIRVPPLTAPLTETDPLFNVRIVGAPGFDAAGARQFSLCGEYGVVSPHEVAVPPRPDSGSADAASGMYPLSELASGSGGAASSSVPAPAPVPVPAEFTEAAVTSLKQYLGVMSLVAQEAVSSSSVSSPRPAEVTAEQAATVEKAIAALTEATDGLEDGDEFKGVKEKAALVIQSLHETKAALDKETEDAVLAAAAAIVDIANTTVDV